MRDAGGLPGLLSSGEASDAVRGSGAWLAFWKPGGSEVGPEADFHPR